MNMGKYDHPIKRDIKAIIEKERAGFWDSESHAWMLRGLTDEELEEYSKLKAEVTE